MPSSLYMISTASGILAASVDAVGILVLAVPILDPDDLDAVRALTRREQIFIAAFADSPGLIYALRVSPDTPGTVLPRVDAETLCGTKLVLDCHAVAGAMAEELYPKWKALESERIRALTAVMRAAPVAEA